MQNEVTRNSVLEDLAQLENAAVNALDSARRYLNRTLRIIENEHPRKSGGWTQFLNETDKGPSSTGTAHGILALLACNEPIDSETVTVAVRFLRSCQCEDGGWTKPSLHNKCSLTRITSLSLRALLGSGSTSSSPLIQKGVDWLLRAQNPDGGWGNTALDNQSDATSTSFALQVLANIPGLSQKGRASIQTGRACLLKARNADNSWGYSNGAIGTVAQTSEAIEGLLACGENPSSLKQTSLWLEQHLEYAPQFSERYLIPTGLSAQESVIWTQVSKERGLIALLALNTSVTSPKIINAVNDILTRQVNGAHWRAESFHNSEPIWAIKEAVFALRLFLNRVGSNRASVALSEEVAVLRRELVTAQQQIQELHDRETRRSWKYRLKKAWNRIPKLSSLVVIGTIILIFVYVVFRYFKHQSEAADCLVAVAGFVGLALGVYPVVQDRQRRNIE